jgi:hydrogenase expression/formation protein HypC
MCLAYPAQLLSVDPDGTATADVSGAHRPVILIALTDPVAPGDWLLVHAGIALARITEQEAADLRRVPAEDPRRLGGSTGRAAAR